MEKASLKEVGTKVKDGAWLSKIRKNFIRKFYAQSTLATKNTKRKKVLEILEGLDQASFPMTVESMTSLAAVLDYTGMRAGDQYLAEAKLLHVEAGYDWDMRMDRQLVVCKRALQRDKGPEVRAKEVQVASIEQRVVVKSQPRGRGAKGVAWSFAWACAWMLRAIEASQVRAGDVEKKFEEKITRPYVRKSKADQKALGTWRTLKCCGELECRKGCAFNLALSALQDLHENEREAPLFPDHNGRLVSKVHMVTAWSSHIDSEISGHSARRSGAMCYARSGMNVQSIKFLGRWKSSAVFRYIEEAMTEIPVNEGQHKQDSPPKKVVTEGVAKRKALRPKQAASPPAVREEKSLEKKVKRLVDEDEKKQVFALSNTKKKRTKHIVGQAAWWILGQGPPFGDGTSRERKLTQKPSKMAAP